MPESRAITELFTCASERCPRCAGSGIVCEEHPDQPWGRGDSCCGAAGMPCRPQPEALLGVMPPADG
jgi:hypothetical protein